MSMRYPAPDLLLPWEASESVDRRFRRTLAVSVGMLLLLSLPLSLFPLQPVSFNQSPQELPLTQITLLEQELPPAPTPEPKPEPKQKIEPEPIQPEPVAKVQPQPPKADKPKAEPIEQPPVDRLAEAREKATASGILAFQDDLMALRDSVDTQALNQKNTRRGASHAKEIKRAMVATTAAARPATLATASFSSDIGGPAISARQAAQVSASNNTAAKGANHSRERNLHADKRQPGGRSDEAIRRIMDENKSAIFAIYNRALRRDPLLEGKLVFEMLISPSGEIRELTLLSSGLGDDQLTKKILSRINLINFGDADALTTRVNYSFDFLPYT